MMGKEGGEKATRQGEFPSKEVRDEGGRRPKIVFRIKKGGGENRDSTGGKSLARRRPGE